MRRFYLLTGGTYPQGHSDDNVLYSRLKREGGVEWLDWTRLPATSVASGGSCLIRTPWEYQDNLDAFISYLGDLETAGAALWNPLATVRWNIDKSYLIELQNLGVATVPTVSGEDFLQGAGGEKMASICVVKPRVGASGRGVDCLDSGLAAHFLHEHNDGREHLVQEFVRSVSYEGETSLIFYRIGGRPVFSHAIRKRPARGEFRIQADFGGREEAENPAGSIIQWATEILELTDARMKKPWIYVRVDLLYEKGRPLLNELEMIEPQLFHRYGPDSTELLTRALLEQTGC